MPVPATGFRPRRMARRESMCCIEFLTLGRANKDVIHLIPQQVLGTVALSACDPSSTIGGVCCTKVYLQVLPVAVTNVTKVLFTCYHSVIGYKAKDDFSLR